MMPAPAASTRSTKVGTFQPEAPPKPTRCGPGEVGYFVASIKEVPAKTAVGDSDYRDKRPCEKPCRATRKSSRRLLRPVPDGRRATLTTARRRWAKLRLNDASFTWEMEPSAALGMGFPLAAFLGLAPTWKSSQERPQPRVDLDLIRHAPSVVL